MNIVRNEKLIRRYGRLGMALSLTALGAMGYGFYLSLQGPENLNTSLALLVVGFILTQISLYIGNRWGRSPRPDEILDKSLKGLGKKYTLYHYSTPVAHLLVGPAGLWVLLPYYQHGRIRYDAQRGRWKQKSAGLGHAYMRLFGQENLGRPEVDAEGELRRLRTALEKTGLDLDALPLHAALVFTSPRIELEDADQSPIPAMRSEKLKKFILRQAKEIRLSEKQIAAVRQALEEEA